VDSVTGQAVGAALAHPLVSQHPLLWDDGKRTGLWNGPGRLWDGVMDRHATGRFRTGIHQLRQQYQASPRPSPCGATSRAAGVTARPSSWVACHQTPGPAAVDGRGTGAGDCRSKAILRNPLPCLPQRSRGRHGGAPAARLALHTPTRCDPKIDDSSIAGVGVEAMAAGNHGGALGEVNSAARITHIGGCPGQGTLLMPCCCPSWPSDELLDAVMRACAAPPDRSGILRPRPAYLPHPHRKLPRLRGVLRCSKARSPWRLPLSAP
jgi:hypothetical protein